MRILSALCFGGTGLLAISAASSASAQSNPAPSAADVVADDAIEIVVQARRRDESIQDVPLVVNAITSETLDKLNIRELKDITSVVPGLQLDAGLNVAGTIATLRGVNFDVVASGNNGTVEFYLNDAPISGGVVLQSLYDIQQIEVLHGPQGTLRGRASPSGSITVTTRRPDTNGFGGYAMGTVNTVGGFNLNAAVNVPVVKGVLALRVAGLYEDNEFNRVRSITSPSIEPFSKTRAVRATALFTPTDSIEVQASYSHLLKRAHVFDQVESFGLALGIPSPPPLVNAFDRRAVADAPRKNRAEYDVFNVRAQWRFAGQKLNYVFSHSTQDLASTEPIDIGNFFDASFPGDPSTATMNLQNYGSVLHTRVKQDSHELRLSSDERLFGVVDYVVGGMINRLEPSTDLGNNFPIFFTATPTPGSFVGILSLPPFALRGRTLEKSLFGNATAHVGEKTELSGGLRYINYNSIGTVQLPNEVEFDAVIWSASAKHNFSRDIMAYVSAGSSWRVGAGTNPITLAASNNFGYTDPDLSGLLAITPERSRSYEIGLRTSWLDRRLTINVSAYHQDFDNFIFSSGAVFIAANDGAGTAPINYSLQRTLAGLSVGVPAKVDGIEGEIAFNLSDRFRIGATLSYADARISNARVPCNPTGVPSVAAIQGGDPTKQILLCTVNQNAGRTPPFSASIQGEYSHPVSDRLEGFIRGLININGSSVNDPVNTVDNVSGYALVNLYARVKAPDGQWEVTAYAKNLFDTERTLSRNDVPALATYVGSGGFGAGVSNYRSVTVTAPREFGLVARFAFGSR